MLYVAKHFCGELIDLRILCCNLCDLQRPFVYDITPSYGPMAGGTEVVIHGAWLNGTNEVRIGVKICNNISQM